MAEPKFDYVNRPDVNEVFVDAVHSLIFDGQTFRLEFVVNRMNEPKPGDKVPTGRQYTCARIVFTPRGGLDLANKLNNMLGAMEKQGMIKKNEPTPQPMGSGTLN
jgi:hypothetical protein